MKDVFNGFHIPVSTASHTSLHLEIANFAGSSRTGVELTISDNYTPFFRNRPFEKPGKTRRYAPSSRAVAGFSEDHRETRFSHINHFN
jgi:hypothetical protein